MLTLIIVFIALKSYCNSCCQCFGPQQKFRIWRVEPLPLIFRFGAQLRCECPFDCLCAFSVLFFFFWVNVSKIGMSNSAFYKKSWKINFFSIIVANLNSYVLFKHVFLKSDGSYANPCATWFCWSRQKIGFTSHIISQWICLLRYSVCCLCEGTEILYLLRCAALFLFYVL